MSQPKFVDCELVEYHIVTAVDNGEEVIYHRYSERRWTERMGESDELADEANLEPLFQQFMSDNSTVYANSLKSL